MTATSLSAPPSPLPPRVDAAALADAGRNPTVPFRIAAGDGCELVVEQLLRVLPGKRVVGKGHWVGAQGPALLIKLFIDRHSARHWQREHEGIAALAAAGIPTPRALDARPLPGGGHLLLTEFLAPARTVLDAWRPLAARPPGDADVVALLTPVFALLGRVHAAGLSHDDLHFGNFLHHGEGDARRLLLIDGDAVRTHAEKPLVEKFAARDLAMLTAQLPRTWLVDPAHMTPLFDAYVAANPRPPAPAALQRALAVEQLWRLRDYLAKTGRDCSLFKVTRSLGRYTAVLRSEAETLAPLLADPDRYLEDGVALKRGNTCTVARVDIGGRTLVVKRYNLKNWRHALSRAWRPSRAAHSWREGHRLRLFGIPTPAPLALVEERRGPLRGRAWLITEHCAGPDLLQHLDPERVPPAAEAAALRRLFALLHRERLSHGDLKATNLLWDEGEVKLIDLDAMQQHRDAASHARAWRRDRRRLLQNWPQGSDLQRWLDLNLPPA